jgi:hypothetical protein
MSDWVKETTPANTAVIAPTNAMNIMTNGDRAMSGLNLTSKKGPAFTIVAA